MSQFQTEAVAWATACFGEVATLDQAERRHRFLEEALELFQAAGGTTSELAELGNYVFSRPPGDIVQELGGTSLTLALLAQAHGFDSEETAWLELVRCRVNINRIRAKQAAKPALGPLPGPTAEDTGEEVEAAPAPAEAEDDGALPQAG